MFIFIVRRSQDANLGSTPLLCSYFEVDDVNPVTFVGPRLCNEENDFVKLIYAGMLARSPVSMPFSGYIYVPLSL